MRLLITGAAGYIGTALRRRVETQPDVIASGIDLEWGQDIRWHRLGRYDVIIHLAAVVGRKRCEEDPALAASINVDGTRSLLNQHEGHFILASTGGVYGNTHWADEETPVNPNSHYEDTKARAEEAVLASGGTVARLNHVCGLSPRMRWNEVGNCLAREAAEHGRLEIYDPQMWRPWTHIDDTVEALLFLTSYEPGIYNVVGENKTKEDVGRMLEYVTPAKANYEDKGIDKNSVQVCGAKLCNMGFHYAKTLNDASREVIASVRRAA